MLGNKRGFFSEEHSDVGGGCECGPCVRAAAAAAAPFVCFPSPTLVPVQTSRIIVSLNFLMHCSGMIAHHVCKFVQNFDDAQFFESISFN